MAVVAVGLAVRFGIPGVVGDILGGACYALLVVLIVGFVAVRASVAGAAATAFAVCAAVELFQLTGAPARLAEAFPAAALVLGSGFAPLDFAGYALGAVAGCAADPLLRPAGAASVSRR